jgi:hypothetical protein
MITIMSALLQNMDALSAGTQTEVRIERKENWKAEPLSEIIYHPDSAVI